MKSLFAAFLFTTLPLSPGARALSESSESNREPEGQRIEITSAVWQGPKPNQSVDVTARLKRMLASDIKKIAVNCKEVAGGGDPAYHQPKTLIVKYTVNGEAKELTWPEGRVLEFSVLR